MGKVKEMTLKDLFIQELEKLRGKTAIAEFDNIYTLEDFEKLIQDGKIHLLSDSSYVLHFFVKCRHCYGYTYIQDVIVHRISEDQVTIINLMIDEVDVDKLVEMMVS